MTKYIGANYVHGVRFGGVDSSFDGIFRDHQVLIGSGLDYIPCVIGDISDLYFKFGKIVAEKHPSSFNDYAICIMQSIQEYFGDYSCIDARMDNYHDLDDIQEGASIGKVSDLKGKNSAMCVERAMVSQNILKLLGIKSYFKCSGVIKNDNKEVHSYNIVEYFGKYYIFDATIPTLTEGEISPVVAEIPKEVFDELILSRTKNGISVVVSHFNPLRNEDVTLVYDAGRDKIYDVRNSRAVVKK